MKFFIILKLPNKFENSNSQCMKHCCRREGTQVPFVVAVCIEEIEARGQWILSCYTLAHMQIIVCPIHVHGVGQTKFSVDVHLYVRTYVCACVRVCTHWIASKSMPLARHVYWPAGLVTNCEQHNWRAVRSSLIGILHRRIKFSTVYCNRIGQTPCSTEHSLSCFWYDSFHVSAFSIDHE